MSRNSIKLLKSEDWESLKLIRLDALRNNSEAFGSSYDNISSKSDSYWINQVEDLNNKFFIQFDELVPIGIIRISLNDLEIPSNFAYLGSLYVKKEYRNQGIAKRLIRTAEESITNTEGITGIYIEVFASLLGAISLYKKLGYRFEKEETISRQKELVMTKRL